MKQLTSLIEADMLLLENRMGGHYEILSEWQGNHYVLNYYGELCYKDCFGAIEETSLFAKQKYNKVTPFKIVKVAGFYIMECREYPNEVFRGTELLKGKYEYDISGDSLEEILDSL